MGEIDAVRGEFSVSNLNFSILSKKLVKKAWVFYVVVVLLQTYSVFPRFHRIEVDTGSALNVLAPQSVWAYVDPASAFADDKWLQRAFVDANAANATRAGCSLIDASTNQAPPPYNYVTPHTFGSD